MNKPKECPWPRNCGIGPLGCDNLLCKFATQKAVNASVKKQLKRQPDIVMMRRFAAMRHAVSRKVAIAAARWMLAYAKDTKNKYRHASSPRTR